MENFVEIYLMIHLLCSIMCSVCSVNDTKSWLLKRWARCWPKVLRKRDRRVNIHSFLTSFTFALLLHFFYPESLRKTVKSYATTRFTESKMLRGCKQFTFVQFFHIILCSFETSLQLWKCIELLPRSNIGPD